MHVKNFLKTSILSKIALIKNEIIIRSYLEWKVFHELHMNLTGGVR